MADKPILFSAPMVLALLDGRKTQTRRMIKIKPQRPILDFVKVATDKDTGRAIYEMKDKDDQHVSIASGKHFVTPHYSPSIAVGDRLYVREAWKVHERFDPAPPSDIPKGMPIHFTADDRLWPAARYRHAMHMPRWASRITLIVEDVKVERLQDISEKDAKAEGVAKPMMIADDDPCTYTDAFASLWEVINGAGSWDANPWVTAYTFRVILKNIDEVR